MTRNELSPQLVISLRGLDEVLHGCEATLARGMSLALTLARDAQRLVSSRLMAVEDRIRLHVQLDGLTEIDSFLNRLGNVFFAKALSWVLGVRLGDSLCGTKLLTKRDYERVLRWRADFGEFDPFGDFELLFPAAVLGLGIVDIPIRYRSRTYGMTNISRFRHGWMLLKMTAIGLFRIKMGRV
jgi:hypothetical protein